MFSSTIGPVVQATLAFVSVILLFGIWLWAKKNQRTRTAKIQKDKLIKTAREYMSGASRKIVLFSNDLSWAHAYREVLERKISDGCEVIAIHKKPTHDRVIRNAKLLTDIGVKAIELVDDHKIRATLIDPDSTDEALLFVAHKRGRDDVKIPLEEGEGGTDKSFIYECAVYRGGADSVLISALSMLAAERFPAKAP